MKCFQNFTILSHLIEKQEYNISMKLYLVTFLFLFASIGSIHANENTDTLLDQAIEEFSKENYDEALAILDEVLEIEPENTTAQMYKKTIEDVAEIDKIEETSELVSTEKNSDSNVNNSENIIDKENASDKPKPDFLSFATYLGTAGSSKFLIEQRAKLYLGLPVFEFGIRTDYINYDVNSNYMDFDGFKDVNIFDNNIMDISMGLRYIPDNLLGAKPGFVDFKLGMSKIYNYNLAENDNLKGDFSLPFIGYDFEIHMLKVFGSNIITDTLWFGSKGSLLFYNSKADNSYFEIKGGLRLGFLNLGAYYSTTDINSLDFSSNSYGVMLGMVF